MFSLFFILLRFLFLYSSHFISLLPSVASSRFLSLFPSLHFLPLALYLTCSYSSSFCPFPSVPFPHSPRLTFLIHFFYSVLYRPFFYNFSYCSLLSVSSSIFRAFTLFFFFYGAVPLLLLSLLAIPVLPFFITFPSFSICYPLVLPALYLPSS